MEFLLNLLLIFVLVAGSFTLYIWLVAQGMTTISNKEADKIYKKEQKKEKELINRLTDGLMVAFKKIDALIIADKKINKNKRR